MINWHHSVFAARLTVVMILSLLTLSSALLILPVFSAFTVTIVGPASSTVGTHVRFNATATVIKQVAKCGLTARITHKS